MIRTVCALVLLGLIGYTQLRKILAKKEMKCASCGRTIIERPVRKEVRGKGLVFCCEHCAEAYVD